MSLTPYNEEFVVFVNVSIDSLPGSGWSFTRGTPTVGALSNFSASGNTLNFTCAGGGPSPISETITFKHSITGEIKTTVITVPAGQSNFQI